MTELEAVRRRIREAHEKRERGDLTARRFERRLADEMVALFREAAREALDPDDRVVTEHHVARAHLRLARSVLSEPEEESTGLFVTERALVRVRAVIDPTGPSARDPYPALKVQRFPLAALRGLRRRSVYRWSEAAAGAAIAAFAVVFSPWLLFTGTLMLALGVAGILHALLLPSRWLEIEVEGETPEPPLEIHKRLRKSGRRLVAALHAAVAAARDGTAGSARGATAPRGASTEGGPAGAPASRPPAEGGPASPSADRRTRVLLVDDDHVFRETLVKVLDRRGFDVTAASDGEEGLARIADDGFDVVVLDLKMPGIDGLEVLGRLRERRPHLPVLMLTGQGTPAAGLDAMDLGAVDFLLKPVTPDRLALAIEAAADGASGRRP